MAKDSNIACEYYNLNAKQKRSFWKVYQDYVKICNKFNSEYMDFSRYVKHISTSPEIFWEFACRYVR